MQLIVLLLLLVWTPLGQSGLSIELHNKLHLEYAELKRKKIDHESLHCLALNAYYEARGEGREGVHLVTQVVLNRAKRSSESVCKVIYKPYQFSWTHQKRKKLDYKLFAEIKKEVRSIALGYEQVPAGFENATHYHALYVSPRWNRNLTSLGMWNRHVFYEENLRKN